MVGTRILRQLPRLEAHSLAVSGRSQLRRHGRGTQGARMTPDVSRLRETVAFAAPPDAADVAPVISVIVPCYNGRVTIRQCVESLCQQSHPAHEIIVVDDGSTDGTLELIGALPVVIVRRERNGGAAVA